MPRWYHERLAEGLPDDAAQIVDAMSRFRVIELEDFGAIRALVGTSDAIALAPYEAIRSDVEAGGLALLDVPSTEAVIVEATPVVLASLEQRSLPRIAPLLMDSLQSVAGEQDADPSMPRRSRRTVPDRASPG